MDLERRLLPFIFIFTGTFNVLILKWSDNIEAECNDGKLRRFQHPIIQVAAMFLGEILCFIVYKISYFFLERRGDGSENWHLLTRGVRDFSPLKFILPALLDAIATIMLFTGLYLTYVSSFQMLRSACIIFVCFYSSIHLNQRLTARHWVAVFTICCGLVLLLAMDVQRVHYDQASLPSDNIHKIDENAVLTGDLLIICAQILQALQLVYVEKHLKLTDMPALQAVGWQGIFGILLTILLGVCANFLPATLWPFGNNSHGVIDDLTDAFAQLRNNGTLVGILVGFMFSSAIFNYAAHSIIKFSSAANCLIAEELRVLLLLWFALVFEWEYLDLMIIASFIIIAMGIVAYRNAIFLEWYRSLLSRFFRNRYMDVSVDAGHAEPNINNRPADSA